VLKPSESAETGIKFWYMWLSIVQTTAAIWRT